MLSNHVCICVNSADLMLPFAVRSLSWHPTQHVLAVAMVGTGGSVAVYCTNRESTEKQNERKVYFGGTALGPGGREKNALAVSKLEGAGLGLGGSKGRMSPMLSRGATPIQSATNLLGSSINAQPLSTVPEGSAEEAAIKLKKKEELA